MEMTFPAGTHALHVRVTSRKRTNVSVSPALRGDFIALEYGVQREGVESEMLYNRGFEPFPTYIPIAREWYGPQRDPEDAPQDYETYWTAEDRYHSDYERYAWFIAQDEEVPFPVDAHSNFLVGRSPALDVRLEPVRGSFLRGEQALRLVNGEREIWGGIAQPGKWLQKGETYRFHGWMRSQSGLLNAQVRFYPEGDWATPIAVIPLSAFDTEFTERSFTWENTAFTGYATFSLWIPPHSSAILDAFSLRPVSRSPATWPLALEHAAVDDLADFQVQATWDAEQSRLVLYGFNATAQPGVAVFDLSALERAFSRAEVAILCGDGPLAGITLENRNAIRREDHIETVECGVADYRIVLPPYSFVQAALTEGGVIPPD